MNIVTKVLTGLTVVALLFILGSSIQGCKSSEKAPESAPQSEAK